MGPTLTGETSLGSGERFYLFSSQGIQPQRYSEGWSLLTVSGAHAEGHLVTGRGRAGL